MTTSVIRDPDSGLSDALFCRDKAWQWPLPQLGHTRLGIEIGPVGKREVGDLARIVGAVGNADFLPGDIGRARLLPIGTADRVFPLRVLGTALEIGGLVRLREIDRVAWMGKGGRQHAT